MKMKKNMRLYWGAFGVYVLSTLLMVLLRNPEAPFGFLWGLLPVVPFLVMLHYLLKMMKGSDEMEQKIMVESFAFAAIVTSSICFAYDMFEGYGLPDFKPVWAFWMTWAFFAVGMLRSWREVA